MLEADRRGGCEALREGGRLPWVVEGGGDLGARKNESDGGGFDLWQFGCFVTVAIGCVMRIDPRHGSGGVGVTHPMRGAGSFEVAQIGQPLLDDRLLLGGVVELAADAGR